MNETAAKLYKWSKTLKKLGIIGAILFVLLGIVVIISYQGFNFVAFVDAVLAHPGVFLMQFFRSWAKYLVFAVLTLIGCTTLSYMTEGIAAMIGKKETAEVKEEK